MKINEFNEIYKKILTDTQESTDNHMPLFFEWLEAFPNFMELSDIEIEINFMLFHVSFMSYMRGYFDHKNNKRNI